MTNTLLETIIAELGVLIITIIMLFIQTLKGGGGKHESNGIANLGLGDSPPDHGSDGELF